MTVILTDLEECWNKLRFRRRVGCVILALEGRLACLLREFLLAVTCNQMRYAPDGDGDGIWGSGLSAASAMEVGGNGDGGG